MKSTNPANTSKSNASGDNGLASPAFTRETPDFECDQTDPGRQAHRRPARRAPPFARGGDFQTRPKPRDGADGDGRRDLSQGTGAERVEELLVCHDGRLR